MKVERVFKVQKVTLMKSLLDTDRPPGHWPTGRQQPPLPGDSKQRPQPQGAGNTAAHQKAQK